MRSGTVEANANGGVNHRNCVTVELLTGETILISTEGKTTCSAVWNQVEGALKARGVVHPQIFGLAIKTGSSDWVFVDPDEKVSKYFPKEKQSTSQNNSGSSNDKTILYCRVNFYLEALPPSFDVVSLLHYYLQLRQNLVTVPRHPTVYTTAIAFAYQAELGDWRPCQEVPPWAQSLNPGPSVTRAHQALSGLGQEAARIGFIRAVMPQYNMHLYPMILRRTKIEEKDTAVWIGVTPRGIEILYGGTCIPEHPKITFLWSNITKLYFERKKFEIRGRACQFTGSTRKLSFTAASESVPRHLLILCRLTHKFHLSSQKLVSTAVNHKGSSVSSSTGGESSCNSTLLGSSSSSSKNDEKMLDLSLWADFTADGLLLAGGGEVGEHQRVSVISNASSNTTSGIVSDRVYSVDGSEEDLDLREISYCCTERLATGNSTSLESLSQKHPPPRHINVPTSHVSASNLTGGEDESTRPMDSEAKNWYCDSDCEDCDDAGPCRSSILVRTIGEKARACAGHCECNSCATEDELDGLDLSSPSQIIHNNTPSMVSEGTLKAVDVYCEDEPENDKLSTTTVTNANSNNTNANANSVVTTTTTTTIGQSNGNSTPRTTPTTTTATSKTSSNSNSNSTPGIIQVVPAIDKTKAKVVTGGQIIDSLVEKIEKIDIVTNCDSKEKDSVQKSKERLEEQKKIVDYDSRKNDSEDKEDDPMEHVYGEICEDPHNNKTDDREYFTIDNKGRKTAAIIQENENCSMDRKQQQQQTTSRNCIKSVETKTRCRGKLLKEFKSSRRVIGCENKSHMTTCGGRECNNKKIFSTNVLGTKENGLTPKIASLKCLKVKTLKGGPTSTTSSSSSWLPERVGKRNALNNKKNNYTNSNGFFSQQNDYVEFGEKLQQGCYPSTRTVSDNFDTDSDYVQLPPLFPRPLPKKPTTSKLWKLVTKTSSNKASSTTTMTTNTTFSYNNKSPISSPCESTTPSPTPGPAVNLNTLPRRHKLEHSQSITNEPSKLGRNSNMCKVSSKSTTALNIFGYGKPEPPPKPLKRHVLTNLSTKPVDARFIATKPQILVQTAYATAAPVAIPSQAQVLFRSSKVPSSTSSTIATTKQQQHASNTAQNLRNYQPLSVLQHSQSVDNIYDTVASEDVPVTISTPPPPPSYPTTTNNNNSNSKGNAVIIKPNNYIDVHASAIKNRKCAAASSKPKCIAQVNGHTNMNHLGIGTGVPCSATTTLTNGGFNGGGKNIASRCGSVPNNLNTFLIGLQNLKPLSRAPIVHPAATSSMSLSSSNNNNNHHSNSNNTSSNVNANCNGVNSAGCLHTSSAVNLVGTSTGLLNVPCPVASQSTTNVTQARGMSVESLVNCNGNCSANGPSRYTTVYTSQLTRSQIQQFKAQLYSDMDYVIFPPKDPRVSQQEYYDSKSLSYTTLPSTNSAAYGINGINDIPPPYLPPPPPYPSVTTGTGSASVSTTSLSAANNNSNHHNHHHHSQPNVYSSAKPPPRPAKTIGIGSNTTGRRPPATLGLVGGSNHSVTTGSCSATSPPSSHQHNSYGSIPLYNVGSNNSQCSSSQYGGYYAAVGSLNLNAENIQRFLSQNLASSNASSNAPIYYPCSTQSAPPLPQNNKNKNGNMGHVIIENEMQKAVQNQIINMNSSSVGATTTCDDKLKMKMCRSEESLYTHPKQTEEKLQAMYNLPPPPAYKLPGIPRPPLKISPSELDLASLRAKCTALELPLLRALLSNFPKNSTSK